MSAAVYNVDADRGGTIAVTVAVTESDGSASDLSGFTGEMQVRAAYDEVEVLAEGVVTISALTGIVTGTIDAADTLDADWNAAVYDIRIASGAIVEYPVGGLIRLRPTVTR